MTHTTGTNTCPNWCIALHLDGDTLHHGASIELAVLRRPSPGERLFRPELSATPMTLELVAHQETGEPAPWIAVLHEGAAVLDLTTLSAEHLAAALRDLAADARR